MNLRLQKTVAIKLVTLPNLLGFLKRSPALKSPMTRGLKVLQKILLGSLRSLDLRLGASHASGWFVASVAFDSVTLGSLNAAWTRFGLGSSAFGRSHGSCRLGFSLIRFGLRTLL